MLKFFSRLERTRNFVLLAVAVVMVLSLILFYAPSNSVQGNLSTSSETVAKVGSETVTVGELVIQKENLSRMYGGQAIPAKFLVDGIVRERILRYEAKRLGLLATDAETAAEIRMRNKPQDGSAFDIKTYERNVTEQYGSINAYEQTVRDSISAEKLRAYVTSGVSYTENEVLDDYKRNTKFDLSYVLLNNSDLAKAISPTDEELKTYFEQNKRTILSIYRKENPLHLYQYCQNRRKINYFR